MSKSDINNVTIVGRLTRDSEKNSTRTGTSVLGFSIASSRYSGQDSVTGYYDCKMFGKVVDSISSYMKKGLQVCVQGQLAYDSWEDDRGNKKSKVYILASNIQMLSSSSNGNSYHEEHDGNIPF